MNTHTILRHTGLLLALGFLAGACDDPNDIGPAAMTDTGDVESGDDGYEDDAPAGAGDDGGTDGDGDGDADDHGEDDGGDAPAACGDGLLDAERGEQCDDGNLDELDGCMTSCRLGPTDLRPDYEVSTPLELRGRGHDGEVFEDECPEGEVIIGMVGRAGAFIDQVQVQCGVIELTSSEPGSISVGLEAGTMLEPPRGGEGGDEFHLSCGAGEAVVGFGGSAGFFLDRLSLSCAPVELIHHPQTGVLSVGLGSRASTGMVGGVGGWPFDQGCPAGEIATTIQGRSAGVITSFGLTCRPLVLE